MARLNAKGRNAKATERQATERQATERQGDRTPRRHYAKCDIRPSETLCQEFLSLLGTLFDTVCVTQAVQPNLSPGWSGDLKGIILNFKLISIEHSSACKAEGVVPIFQNVPLSLCNNCMCIWNFGIFFFKNRMALFPL